MNIQKLKEAEHLFFLDYPQGFNSPELVKTLKKHKMGKTVDCKNNHQTLSNRGSSL